MTSQYPPSQEAYVLQYWLTQKGDVACELYTALHSDGEYQFYLTSSQGTALVKVLEDSTLELDLHLPALFGRKLVHLYLSSESAELEGDPLSQVEEDLIDTIASIIMQMELAPYMRVPYGLVYNDQLIGIVFFSPLNQLDESLTAAGCRLEIYVCDHINNIFPFINEENITELLYRFWEAYRWTIRVGPRVMYLGEILRGSSAQFSREWGNGMAWIEFGSTRYWRWDIKKHDYATNIVPPRVHISLPDWFWRL